MVLWTPTLTLPLKHRATTKSLPLSLLRDRSSPSLSKPRKKKKSAEEGGTADQAREKKTASAASVRKQPPVQEWAAAIQPVKAAAVDVE